MAKLFANSEDPDQTPHSTASSGSALFANYLLGVSRLEWVKGGPQKCCIQTKNVYIYGHFSI